MAGSASLPSVGVSVEAFLFRGVAFFFFAAVSTSAPSAGVEGVAGVPGGWSDSVEEGAGVVPAAGDWDDVFFAAF